MTLLNADMSPKVCNRLVSLTGSKSDSALSAAARNPALFALLDLNKGVKAVALKLLSAGKHWVISLRLIHSCEKKPPLSLSVTRK